MSLKKALQEDWKEALKSGDKLKANTISMAKAAILQIEKTDGITLNDDEIIEVLAKEVKQRHDAIEEFKKGNRQDLIDENEKEINILLKYLPQQLTREEIIKIIEETANDIGVNSIKQMGKLMSNIMPKVTGKADGKLVSQLVKEYLNK